MINALLLVARVAFLGAPAVQGTAGDPAVDPAASAGAVREYTTGIGFGIAESSWIHQPQIERPVSTPSPKIVPTHKTPPMAGAGHDARGLPAPKKYSGFSGISHTGWVPPDPTLGVGPDHVLQTVNMQIAWFTKAGALQFSVPLNDTGNPGFFETVGARGFTFDPKCFYDEHAGRFVVVAPEVYSNEAWLCIAVSDDSDPNGFWFKYRTDAVTWDGANSYWLDYPGFGYDQNNYYVTGNLFGLNNGGWGGVKYRIYPKTPLLSGQPATWLDLRDPGSGSVQVAEHHTGRARPLFVSSNGGGSIKIQAILDPDTAPSLVATSVSVPGFSGPPGAPELGGGTIDTLDGRIINADYQQGSLLCGHGINNGNGKAVARWYEFAVGNWPSSGTSVTLVQSGDVDLDGDVYTWYPALCMNAAGEIGMIMAFSSASEYAGLAIAARTAADPPGTMPLAQRVKLGTGSASGRWGDYFDCCLDPSDPTKFWGVGEYPNWTTWIESFDATPDFPTSGLLYSTAAPTTVGGGFHFEDGDIIHLDPATGVHSMFLDLSDVTNLPADIDAFALLPDQTLLISFIASEHLPGLTGGPSGDLVDDEDLVRFTPAHLGEETAGTWSFHFDGSDVGLDTSNEDIDGLALDAAGNLLISFSGAYDVGGGLTGKDEDVLLFAPTALGAVTAGSWAPWFNGNDPDVKLGSPGEDVDALDFHLATGTITVSTSGDFRVPNGINGENRDLIQFTPTLLGSDTNGTWLFTFDGDTFGLAAADLDALHLLP